MTALQSRAPTAPLGSSSVHILLAGSKLLHTCTGRPERANGCESPESSKRRNGSTATLFSAEAVITTCAPAGAAAMPFTYRDPVPAPK